MIFTELLKEQGLTEEQIAAITGEMSKNKIFITNEEKIDERYAKMKLERDDLKEKLSKADETITDLKKNNKDNETLQATIKTHETTIATMKTEYEDKIRDLAINSAIQAKLTDTKYADLLVGKFDKTKLSVAADGTVVGIDEQLTAIKETYKDLFTPTVTGRQPNNTGGSPNGVKNPWSKEHFNLTEQGKLLTENPELAKQLMAAAK